MHGAVLLHTLLSLSVSVPAAAAPPSRTISPGPRIRTEINPKDGAAMVLIPAGPFLMGDRDQRFNPRHTVTLSAYYIYKNLVTVGMYKKFCAATGRQMPPSPKGYDPTWALNDDPVTDVTWEDAKAYCMWAGVALPTEAQWEKAARGTDGREFPWGNRFDASKPWCRTSAVLVRGPTAVGKYGISPYGVTDMAGNASQWCADWYTVGFWKSRAAKGRDPVNLNNGGQEYRVMRGGSWDYIDPGVFRCSNRGNSPPSWRHDNYGFRCVRSLNSISSAKSNKKVH